jgi:hypothetical protein
MSVESQENGMLLREFLLDICFGWNYFRNDV